MTEINSYSSNNMKFVGESVDCPVSVRGSLFGYAVGTGFWAFSGAYPTKGLAHNSVTFRPVIWN